MDLLIVGSAAYDTVETAAGRVEEALGGAAVYSSVAAGFYCRPAVVAVVGEDFQEEHLRFLESRGIALEGLQRKPGRTFRWAGRYLPDMIGRQTLETQLNVFADFDPVLPPDLRELHHVFLANIHPGLQKKVLDQVSAPRLVVGDTMNLWIETAREELLALFPRLDLLVVNDEEVRMITGVHNIVQAGRKVLERGVRQAVVIKRGEHGCTLVTSDGVFIVPAFPVENLVDPTGAGDSFAGAFVGYLARIPRPSSRDFRLALVHGAAMASFTVEGFSLNRLREISRHDVEQRVSAIKNLMRLD